MDIKKKQIETPYDFLADISNQLNKLYAVNLRDSMIARAREKAKESDTVNSVIVHKRGF